MACMCQPLLLVVFCLTFDASRISRGIFSRYYICVLLIGAIKASGGIALIALTALTISSQLAEVRQSFMVSLAFFTQSQYKRTLTRYVQSLARGSHFGEVVQ